MTRQLAEVQRLERRARWDDKPPNCSEPWMPPCG